MTFSPHICSFVGDLSHLASSKVPTLTRKHECPCKPRVRSEAPNRFFAPPNVETKDCSRLELVSFELGQLRRARSAQQTPVAVTEEQRRRLIALRQRLLSAKQLAG